jgi:molybdate transport system substrate-binding protein
MSARVESRAKVLVIVSVGLAFVLLPACSGPASSSTAGSTIQVSAASSLSRAFQDLGSAFQELHPTIRVQMNFAGSSTLVTQLENGAPADVFASADQANMDKVAAASLLEGGSQTFARNKLTIVVAKGNPKRITGLRDLSRAGVTTSMCGPDVPIGRYARQALANAGASVPQGSHELDVKQVLSRVMLGQADAGIVYSTDAQGAPAKVESVDIPADQNVVASYPISAVKSGGNSAAGRQFVDFVLSDQGRSVLTSDGFLVP